MGVGLRRARARSLNVAVAVALLAAATGACGGENETPQPPPDVTEARDAPKPDRPSEARPERSAKVEIPDPPACVDDGAACVQASGRILYVERVDPDGDGDAHFVTTSSDSITAPGITVFDVRTDLRPDPLPGPGDAISASGPVLEGSFGQRQIEADAVAVAYAR